MQGSQDPPLDQAQWGRGPGQNPNSPPLHGAPPSRSSPQHPQSQRTLGLKGTRGRHRGTQGNVNQDPSSSPSSAEARAGGWPGVTKRGLGFPVCSGEATGTPNTHDKTSVWGMKTGPASSPWHTVPTRLSTPGACCPRNATGPQGAGFPSTCISAHPWWNVCFPLPELIAPPLLGAPACTLPCPSLRVPSWEVAGRVGAPRGAPFDETQQGPGCRGWTPTPRAPTFSQLPFQLSFALPRSLHPFWHSRETEARARTATEPARPPCPKPLPA